MFWYALVLLSNFLFCPCIPIEDAKRHIRKRKICSLSPIFEHACRAECKDPNRQVHFGEERAPPRGGQKQLRDHQDHPHLKKPFSQVRRLYLSLVLKHKRAFFGYFFKHALPIHVTDQSVPPILDSNPLIRSRYSGAFRKIYLHQGRVPSEIYILLPCCDGNGRPLALSGE